MPLNIRLNFFGYLRNLLLAFINASNHVLKGYLCTRESVSLRMSFPELNINE